MTGTVPARTAVNLTRDFRWSEVPPDRSAHLTALAAPAAPDLGPLTRFAGEFTGNGLNTIFRPQNFAASPTPLPNPAQGPDDNILEVNLTEETLKFSDPL